MRGIINPHRSGPHRLACLALYRGLLKQAIRLPDETSSSYVIELVRKRFRLDREITSAQVIVHALDKGRKAYSIIRTAANGSTAAQKQLCTTLEQTALLAHDQIVMRTHQNSMRRPTQAKKATKIAHLENHRSKAWSAKIPDPIPIMGRPVPRDKLPYPEKPRKVPILTTTQALPFLRYKAGPQSPKLSWALRSYYKQDFKRWSSVERLKHEFEHGKLEDQWDDEMRAHSSKIVGDESNGWTSDLRPVQKELMSAIEKRIQDRKERTQRLDDIVQAEQRLALQEKEERKAKGRAEFGAKSISDSANK